ncbi:MAG: sulfatase-like hydrolase/transferase [Patescibacteria group bacterium]
MVDSAIDSYAQDSGIPADSETGSEAAETGETGSGDLIELGPDVFAGRNVVVISVDTLGANWVGTGYTLNLDGILEESVQLQNHNCSTAWTPPCMASLVAGSQATDLGTDILGFGSGVGFNVVPDSRTLFPEILQESGYSTYLLTENSLFGGGTNTGQGFQTYVNSDVTSGKGALTADVTAFAAQVVTLNATGTPFLAWFHPIAPHTPYIDADQDAALYAACTDGKDELPDDVSLYDDKMSEVVADAWDSYDDDTKSNIVDQVTCAYGAQVAWTDEVVFKNLWEELLSSGAFDNTVVVLVSDHGEELNDHEGEWGHNRHAYGVLNHVLGAFWAPDIAPQTVTIPTNMGDVAPTLLGALGLEVSPDMTGSAVWEIPSDRIQDFYACDMSGKTHYAALNMEGVKQHRTPQGNVETYDIFTDPEETGTASTVTDADLQSAIDTLRITAQDEEWCGGN